MKSRIWLLLILEAFLIGSMLLFSSEVNQHSLTQAVRAYYSNPTFDAKLSLNAKYAAAAQKRLYITLWFLAAISFNTALLIYLVRRRQRPMRLEKRRPPRSPATILDCMSNDSQTAAAERLHKTAVTMNDAAQEILKAAVRAKTETVRASEELKRPLKGDREIGF